MQTTEPFAVLDIFVSGMAKMEILKGGNARFTYFVENTLEDGTVERVTVCKLVMPLEAIPDARKLVNNCLFLANKANSISQVGAMAAH